MAHLPRLLSEVSGLLTELYAPTACYGAAVRRSVSTKRRRMPKPPPPGGGSWIRGVIVVAASKGLKICVFYAGPDPGNPPNRPEMGAPGRPDIVGLSSEIIGFRNRGGGPVGHPLKW